VRNAAHGPRRALSKSTPCRQRTREAARSGLARPNAPGAFGLRVVSVREARRSREPACKPGSVVGQPFICDVRRRTPVATYPGDARGPRAAAPKGCALPYLVLLRVGFTVPRRVATRAVRSYRTFSPLPAPRTALWRSDLCGTFRGLAPPRRYLAPCPAEPGLSSAQCAAAARPTPGAKTRGAARPSQCPRAQSPPFPPVPARSASARR
jgi:hypothetical protein